MSSDSVSPRILVQTTIFDPNFDNVADVRYEAVGPHGCVSDGSDYRRDIIGFAEFPPYTQVGSGHYARTFVELVEDHADYVHWKTDEYDELALLVAEYGGGDGVE